MILLDEIWIWLSESMKLKNFLISSDLFGAISSIVVFGSLVEASEEQIESAIGLYC